MSEHPLRHQLHNEIHARPYERVGAPAQISHQVMLVSPAESQQAYEHLCELLANLHLAAPNANSMFHTEQIGPVRLRWERHGEFISYTFITHEQIGPEGPPFERCACDRISADWRARISPRMHRYNPNI